MTHPRVHTALVALVTLAASSSAPAQTPRDLLEPVAMPLPPRAQCYWKRDSFLPRSAPDDLPGTALASIEAWWPFALEHDYRIDVEREGRVLMLSDHRERRTRDEMILVEETLALFDMHLPDEPLDPEETMSVDRLTLPLPSTRPVVLLRLRDEEDLGHCMAHLVGLEPRLASWAHSSALGTGFRLSDPSVAAWIVDPEVEEWREENELVNRLSHSLLEGRFGRQPHWLAQGIAWYAELELTDGIWCFPNRDGFVGVSEHSGWESELRRTFLKRKSLPVSVEEVAGWQRGTWDDQAAALSWGLVTFLIEDCLDEDELDAEEEDRILADIVREMGAHRQTFGVRTSPDGSWTEVPGFELSAGVQRQIIEHHAGAGLWDEVTRCFWMGSRYKPSRTR